VLLFFLRKYGIRALSKMVGSWLVGILLFSAPWLIRNVSNTGNPVYPLFQETLKKPHIKEWHDAKGFFGTSEKTKKRPRAVISNYKELMEVLIGIRYEQIVMYQTGWILGLFLLAAVPFFCRGSPFVFARATSLVALASFLTMSTIVLIPRYALVCFIFLSISVSLAMFKLSENKVLRFIISIIIFSNIFFHGTIKNLVNCGLYAGVTTALGASPERFEFVVHRFPEIRIHEFVGISDFAKKNIGDNEKVLMIGLYTPYRFSKPFHYSSYIDRQFIDETLDSCETPVQLRDFLVRQGFRYILFDHPAWEQYNESHLSRMTSEKAKILDGFFKQYSQRLAFTENLSFYKIILNRMQ